MNSMVLRRYMPRMSLASLITCLSSATPEATALTCLKLAWVWEAMIRARVVFPLPGGPQSTIEGRRSASMLVLRALPLPIRCS